MTAINYAVGYIKREINQRILNRVFKTEHRWNRFNPTDTDGLLVSKVIRPLVLEDCNLIAGIDALIDLTRCKRSDLEDFTTIYRIPKELSNNRSIIQPIHIRFIHPGSSYNFNMGSQCGRSGILMGAKAIVDAAGDMPVISNHMVDLIGENVIRVYGSSYIPMSSFLYCKIEYDDNLQSLSPRSYPVFAEACLLATKMYIYREMDMELDEGEIKAGQDFGAIRRIVDSYADASEQYKEFRKMKLNKVLNMQENEVMRKLIQTMLGGYV